MIDTGADVNLIGKSFVKGLSINHHKRLEVQGIGNKRFETFGEVQIHLRFDGFPIAGKFQVVNDFILRDHDVFIGTHFVLKHKLILDFNRMKVYNNNFSTDLMLMRDLPNILRVMRKKYKEEKVSKCTRPVISKVESSIVNHDHQPKEKFDLDHLNNEVRNSISCVLNEYPKVFSPLKPEEFPSLQFDSLDLMDHRAIQTKIYRYPKAHEQLIKDEMQKLLDLKVISH